MPSPIACPSCGKKLRIPDEMRGRRVKCPACTKSFTAAHPGIGGLIVIGSAAVTGLFSVVLYMLSVMRLSASIDRMMPRIAEG